MSEYYTLEPDDQCAELVARWEGFEAKAYKDIVGVVTIGYGSTRWFNRPGQPIVRMGETITRQEALELLEYELKAKWDRVKDSIEIDLAQNEVNALASLLYNIGESAFLKSTLLKKLNQGDIEGAAEQFLRWNRAGGKEVRGLTNRRRDEYNLFLS